MINNKSNSPLRPSKSEGFAGQAKFKKNNNLKRGQILLITVMLLATAITVIMTISFSSRTETQITKLEEGSQKALSAAEAGLEAAIQKKTNIVLQRDLTTFQDGSITGQANIVEVGGKEFVTPLLQRDEQYLFYLTSYNQPTFGSDYWQNYLMIYTQSEAGACPALELTLIASDNSISRSVMDYCANIMTTGGINNIPTTAALPSDTPGDTVDQIKFAYRATNPINLTSTNKLLIVRVLNASTRIGFKGSSRGDGIYDWVNLRSQGRLITSEAKTQDGITKRIELFQSYPQVPADFFVTSF